MDALKKQANKLREQVAKQQQAVLKQFSSSGYGGSDTVVTDEAELQRHQLLEKLYISTRTGKHFQRDIVRGVEGLIASGSRQIEIGTKLSEDCRKYGVENPSFSGGTLAKAASIYGLARAHMEKERDNLNKALSSQIVEPLRAMVMGAPLEDARHLAQRYDRMRQEAELQLAEVARRQARAREAPGNTENAMKLQAAEARMQELKANMAVLGKEAAAAMAAVESQQQRLTLQRLIALAETEKAYHRKIAQILDEVEAEMISERQRIESAPPTIAENYIPPPAYEEFKVNSGRTSQASSFDMSVEKAMYFLAEAMHAFEAESESELSLAVGDYIVVRQYVPGINFNSYDMFASSIEGWARIRPWHQAHMSPLQVGQRVNAREKQAGFLQLMWRHVNVFQPVRLLKYTNFWLFSYWIGLQWYMCALNYTIGSY